MSIIFFEDPMLRLIGFIEISRDWKHGAYAPLPVARPDAPMSLYVYQLREMTWQQLDDS